ncbi:hypothetical protein GCM10009789_84850 [Kribbella sancticallisti]|uniref:DUF3800 domain-containing protein n=1 Tax=Kribbella sancticallisti TaxID=460087 RepID=A0ABN2EU28_9ACTN
MSLVEIACDESGYEGEKLVGGVTDVFAHASVVLDEAAAAECVAELRRRIRSPATVYKANHLQRSKHRPVLLWLLGPEGPVLGNAQVLLVDKTYFLVARLTEHLVGLAPDDLYAAGRSTGGTAWEDFLAAGNYLLRVRDYPDVVPNFFQSLDKLEFEDATLTALRQSREYAEEVRAKLFELPRMIPPLDPLLPAIARAVEYWGHDEPVAVAHDRQTTLWPERIEQLRLGARLARLELVDSFIHSGIQVADFLAGVARKIASDQLKGEDDAELTALIRPYLDPRSVWGDPASWKRLTS